MADRPIVLSPGSVSVHFHWLRDCFGWRTPPAAVVVPPTAQPRLLLVEDDWSTHAALRRSFAGRGWEVASSSTVAGAMLLLAARPRAVILDLMLADGAGLDVLRRIRAGRVPVRVVVTTGATDPKLLAEVAALAPDALIFKPVDLDALLDAVGAGG